jgi:hypothetical protein
MNKRRALLLSLFLSQLALAGGVPSGSLPQSAQSDIGYKTVAKTLAGLKTRPGLAFSTVRGWTIVTDEAQLTVWSFAPASDPSYPSVVKRMVISTAAGSTVTLKVLCESTKASCDNLVREFADKSSRGSGAPPAHK